MIIYKITNTIDDKIYIGQSMYNDPNYLGSGLIIVRLVKKIGRENFKKEILEHCNSRDHLNEREKFWIKELNSMYPNGYNIKEGGYDSKLSDEAKKNISEKVKKFMTSKVRNAISKSKKSYYSKNKFKEETKNKISNSLKGKKLSESEKQRMSTLHLKRKFSKKTRLRMSKAAKERLSDKKNHPFYGKKHSDETKDLMRKAKISQ